MEEKNYVEEQLLTELFRLRLTKRERQKIRELAAKWKLKDSNAVRRALSKIIREEGIEIEPGDFETKPGGNWLPKATNDN